MNRSTLIVNRLLEDDEDELTPDLMQRYLHGAGDYALLVPDAVPPDNNWHVLTIPVRTVPYVPTAYHWTWKKLSTHPTKEEADTAAQTFLQQHGRKDE